ncbi:PD-(D/E)XK endonuclease-like domain-containing protein OS=Lysinibacillus sphaericus OX=1421 GN=LS41612_04765 PE=4 SV=1 [Lysinibacillus sphaericus]
MLRELFNSGYLYVKGINAQSAMRTLDMLQEISKTFTTFDDWYDGLAEIIELKQEAESKLKPGHSVQVERSIQMYSFYHEAIGYFYCTKEDLRFVRSAITKIKQLFELLFKGNEINIKQYIEILEGHIEQEIIPVISDTAADKKIAENIIAALDELKDDSLDKMDRQDLVQGLQYFLAQKPDLEDEYEMELYGQQDQNNLNIINSLLNSDGLQFEDNRVIHFTMMDNEAFPTQQPLNSWPISHDSF